MSFFAVFFALLLDQARPLTHRNWVHANIRVWVRWVLRSLDTGQSQHGVLVWAMAVGLPVLLTALVHWVLWSYSLVLTFVWAVLVLYLTLGFRQFSHHFTEVRTALERGDETAAQQALVEWQRVPVDGLTKVGVVKQVIECSALSVHKHVLGVLVCFLFFWLLGLGPSGAVLFRLAAHLAGICRANPQDASAVGVNGPSSAGVLVVLDDRQPSDNVCNVARQAWQLINHWPARATALAFAVVGNFEEAVANWRQDPLPNTDPNDTIVLAATAGALNLKWGSNSASSSALTVLPQLAHLTSLVGLVWRSVVLWMLFLALVTLARSMG
jgi:adenosylcobinamide-phosphate synthase